MNEGTMVNNIWYFAILYDIAIKNVVARKYNGILNNLDEVNILNRQALNIPVPQSANINTQRV